MIDRYFFIDSIGELKFILKQGRILSPIGMRGVVLGSQKDPGHLDLLAVDLEVELEDNPYAHLFHSMVEAYRSQIKKIGNRALDSDSSVELRGFPNNDSKDLEFQKHPIFLEFMFHNGDLQDLLAFNKEGIARVLKKGRLNFCFREELPLEHLNFFHLSQKNKGFYNKAVDIILASDYSGIPIASF